MLRLTRTTLLPHEVVLRAEGQIVSQWVGLLEEECLDLLHSNHRVLLDLAGVTYVERSGVTLLRRLIERSVLLINGPPLVNELVREEAS